MTLTELISQLEKIKKDHGDLEVCYMGEMDSWFAFDFSATFEVMEIETFEGSEKFQMILAHVPSNVFFEADPEPHLKIVK